MRWRPVLLTLCVLSTLWIAASTIDNVGINGHAWYGWWDSNYSAVGSPFVARFAQPVSGGAVARARIAAGDWIDLREQSLYARVSLAAQPMAARAFSLVVHHGKQRFDARVAPTTLWQGDTAAKQWTVWMGLLGSCWFVLCAFLIAARRADLWEGRMLAFILLCEGSASTGLGNAFPVPEPHVTFALFLLPQLLTMLGMILLVALSSQFGIRTMWRRAVEWFAYAAITAEALDLALFACGIMTLRVDPLPVGWLNFNPAPISAVLETIGSFAIVSAAACSIGATSKQERTRAAWLIAPLAAAALVITLIFNIFTQFATTWAANQALVITATICLFLAALAVTYAILRRRVLDFEFVLSRTLVVATVSLIVVAAFILLEWLLGSVLSGVSRDTGILANALLALGLGLSLRFIHMRVDAFIDALLFRKRHADERALLDFAREASYATDVSALLDTAIAKIQRHTDARSAALLVQEQRSYAAVRAYGNGSLQAVNENDAAILALKAAQKAIDPHRYDTILAGAMAVPMISRGRVLGVLLLGERAGNEAYAPDEVEALSQFAHGVGSALDSMPAANANSVDALHEALTSGFALLDESIRALPDAIAARLRQP